MPSNVEIKAAVHDLEQLIQKAKLLSNSEGTTILQQDTFFSVPNGRLKLRNLMNGTGQLIFYERPDVDGPKLSNYSISVTNDPDGLKKVLSDALGVKGTVKKERHLYMVGQTRVHVDTVEGLGHFMELEVVLNDGQTEEEGEAIAHKLMNELGVRKEDLIVGAYMDLLLADKK
uniref:Si:ch211-156b7.4 n=1 Tax=Lepisosteus oculatus TaxID=7918 RepID=W5NJ96_LEPOC